MNLKRAITGFLLSFIFLVLFLYIISGIRLVFENSLQVQGQAAFSESVSGEIQNVLPQDISENIIQPFPMEDPKLEVNAESAISVESNLNGAEKIIFEKNGNTQLPIASLTKLMTAVIVLDNYNLSDTIVVDKIADSQNPMKQDVKLGDMMPVESFLDIMLIESSNKSAYALSEKMGEPAFVSLMNRKAREIGMENTFFIDPTGLSPENVSTANDLASFAKYILKNYPLIAEISRIKELYVPGVGDIINTNQILQEFPNVICSKTGFTTEAKGCLLLVMNNPQNNNYLISVILGADDRFSEMKKLIDYSSQICKQLF
jgi:D-alanyl-D-alanine carboxypeptidase